MSEVRSTRLLVVGQAPLMLDQLSGSDWEVSWAVDPSGVRGGEDVDVIVCELDPAAIKLHSVLARQGSRLARVMIFVSDGRHDARQRVFLRESRCAVLTRPFELAELRARIDRLLSPRVLRAG
jgi:hypothetical protein